VDEMHSAAIAISAVGIITVLALIFYPLYGILIIFLLLLAGGVYLSRPKCAYCGARGKIHDAGSETVNSIPAYGLVSRTDVIVKNRTRSDGTSYEEHTHVSRQERVPTLRITTRHYYQCSNCSKKWSKDSLREVEDFSREPPTDPNKTLIIEREVVKIPCRYCGMLVDPARDSKCPSCGSNLTMVRS
jgi:hypothetical protein